MHHNMPLIYNKWKYIKQKIIFYYIKLNHVWFTLSSRSAIYFRDSRIQSHLCQITVHKINMQCVHHLQWCMPDNATSLSPQVLNDGCVMSFQFLTNAGLISTDITYITFNHTLYIKHLTWSLSNLSLWVLDFFSNRRPVLPRSPCIII